MKDQAIGIDLGGTNIRLGLFEDNSLKKIIVKKISSHESQDFIINEIIESINELFSENVKGIGIGVPSIVDTENGIVYEVHNIPSWKEVYLQRTLEEKFNVPARVNNDVNCFILGEKHFGKGKNYKNIIGLAMGTGLGGGIIINNSLYSGKNGGAGEFGLMKYLDKNYEYYCSGQFFKSEHEIDGELLLQKAKESDKKAINIFNDFGIHVGHLINSIMYGLNPELILLGGSVSSSYEYFKNSMLEVISTHEFATQLKDIIIEKSDLEHAAVHGAVSLVS